MKRGITVKHRYRDSKARGKVVDISMINAVNPCIGVWWYRNIPEGWPSQEYLNKHISYYVPTDMESARGR